MASALMQPSRKRKRVVAVLNGVVGLALFIHLCVSNRSLTNGVVSRSLFLGGGPTPVAERRESATDSSTSLSQQQCNYSDPVLERRIQCIQSDLRAPLSAESCEFLRTAQIPESWRDQLYYHDLPTEQNAAVCKQKQSRNWKFLTFGDVTRSGEGSHARKASAKVLRDKVSRLANFGESFAFTMDDIDTVAMTKYQDMFDDSRVFNMLAKPYLINRTAHSYPEGTILVWLDSDIDFVGNLDLFGCLAENSERGFVPIHASHYLEQWFTKRDLFLHLGMDSNHRVRETSQIQSGLFSLRVTKYTRQLLSEWLSLCYQPRLFRGDVKTRAGERNPNLFWKHREDQSVLSLLVKREGIPSYPTPYTNRDRTDITSILAGYCEEGVNADILVYNEWQRHKGRVQMEWFRTKLPFVKHQGWFERLGSAYLLYWDSNGVEVEDESFSNANSTISSPSADTPTSMDNEATNMSESIEKSLAACYSAEAAVSSRIQCVQSDLTAPLSEESCEFLRTAEIPPSWRDRLYYHDLPTEPNAAVCKTETSRDWKFITFGGVTKSGRVGIQTRESAKRLSDKVSNLTNFGESFAFSLDDIDADTLNEHTKAFDHPDLYHTLAKPYLLNRSAHSYPEGTILVWLDSDIDFERNLDIFGCLAENSNRGIIPMHANNYLEQWLTRRDVFLYLKMDDEKRVKETLQIQTGLISLRVTKYTRQLLSEWLSLCYQPQLFQGDVPSLSREPIQFWRHRSSQSIFSLLVKREGIPSYPVPHTGRDRQDITSIIAGYCEEGVDADLLVSNEWQRHKGHLQLQGFRKKLPKRKHRGWFERLESTFLQYWDLNTNR